MIRPVCCYLALLRWEKIEFSVSRSPEKRTPFFLRDPQYRSVVGMLAVPHTNLTAGQKSHFNAITVCMAQ
jgi:hypothetical protein